MFVFKYDIFLEYFFKLISLELCIPHMVELNCTCGEHIEVSGLTNE